MDLQDAKKFAELLDNRFSFMGIRFGIDSLLNIVPGLGDNVGLLLSLYFIYLALINNLPSEKIGQMLINILIDYVIGLVPILGIFADTIYKSNIKNLQILEEHFGVVEDREKTT